eukprot:6287770-Lingulodinium_polyedra.AAC.1
MPGGLLHGAPVEAHALAVGAHSELASSPVPERRERPPLGSCSGLRPAARQPGPHPADEASAGVALDQAAPRGRELRPCGM